MRRARMGILHTRLLLAFVVSVFSAAAFGQSSNTLDPHAAAQIQALLQEKESRTPVQKKIDSNLLYALKMSRGQPIANGINTLETGILTDVGGRVVVDIVALPTDAVFETIDAAGGRVIDAHRGIRNIRAEIPIEALENIAALPQVVFINPKQESVTLGNDGPRTQALKGVSSALLPKLPAGFAGRAAALRAKVAAAMTAQGGKRPTAILATNVSEGDKTHRADVARAIFGFDGTGVKVGVMSNGVASLAAIQASGDLGPVTVLPGQAGSGDEGTAMLEIVHDLAPGAQLYFATANPTIAQFAQNIKDLRTAGCDIIVDDVFYFVETPFQRGQAPSVVSNTNGGLVTDAIATVTAAGALYFSSSGNEGNLDDNTSGTWEGDFADGGQVAAPITGTGNLHDFDPGAGVTAFNTVTVAASFVTTLHWSDPLGASSNDYDLFRLNSTGTAVLSSSTNVQSGTQDPYEQTTTAAAGNRIVIVKRTGAAARFLHLSVLRGQLTFGTVGETHGHSATPVPFAYTVAATPAHGPFGAPPNPVGPYPNPFNSSNLVELFSSDGPRRVFFNADSSAITPGDFSSTGGVLIQKPDFTAADGVACATPGFNPFYGTSAAAPHAAAIAALLKSAVPAATQTQIQNALTSSAIDIQGAGVDRDSGAGILDAVAADTALGVTQHAYLAAGTVTLNEISGNGNGFVEPGECGSLTLQLQNISTTVAATGVSAVVTTSTPGVTITVGNATYPDIPAGGSGTNIPPIKFSLSNTLACPTFIDFTVTLTYTGGAGGPQVLHVIVRAGFPAVNITSTLDATPPPLVTGVSATATGQQNGRLFRNGVASACGAGKAFPGTSGTGTNRAFDSYTFHNCTSASVCVTVNFTDPSGGALMSEAYLTSFTPANVATNYLADFGLSGSSTYSFDVPANTDFIIVVNEVNLGGGAGASYTLNVDGYCVNCVTYAGTGCATCPTITVAPATLPNGTVGVPYNQVVTPSGGTGPYTFNVTGLPAGMSFTPSAGSVTLNGTPTASFSGTVTVSGYDANVCVFSKAYSFSVSCPAPPPVIITAADPVCSLSVNNTASVTNNPNASYAWVVTNGTITGGQGTNAITYTAGASGPITITLTVTDNTSGCTIGGGFKSITVNTTCGSFYTLAGPCRLVDTRDPNGTFGGPALAANAGRTFPVAGNCGIPADAKAVYFNLVAVNATVGGDFRLFPTGASLPLVSALNFNAFRNRANNALTPLGTSGQVDVFCDMPVGSTGTSHIVIDVYGYIR